MWRILARAKPYVVVGVEVCAECGEVRGREVRGGEARGQGVKHESKRGILLYFALMRFLRSKYV